MWRQRGRCRLFMSRSPPERGPLPSVSPPPPLLCYFVELRASSALCSSLRADLSDTAERRRHRLLPPRVSARRLEIWFLFQQFLKRAALICIFVILSPRSSLFEPSCCSCDSKLVSLLQERADGLSGSSPGARLSQLSSLNQAAYSSAPPLCHTPASDFQPPYFPPPYPQSSLPYSQSQDSAYSHLSDPYPSINSIHQHQQAAWHSQRTRSEEGALLAQSHRALSLDPRREYPAVPRLLHGLGEGAAALGEGPLGMHLGHHGLEDLQVSHAFLSRGNSFNYASSFIH